MTITPINFPNALQLHVNLARLPTSAQQGVVAIGNFDGVHLGHQAVISIAARTARELQSPLGVMTFDPHPARFFRPADAPNVLTPQHIKARYLAQLGVQHFYIQKFNKQFSELSAAHFVNDILINQLNVRHVVVGENFYFGHKRTGDASALVEQGKREGFGVTVVKPARDMSGALYSSSKARALIAAGKVKEARGILGRPFEVEVDVIKGAQQGRAMGAPTANAVMGDYIRPAYGVYMVKVAVLNDGPRVWHRGIANIGKRPTVDGITELLETHLLDFNGDLYDKTLRIQFLDFVRAEARFSRLENLQYQIARDIETAKKWDGWNI